MGKGLPRSQARGPELRQEIVKKTIPINHTISVDGATGVGFGSVVIGALPEGNILLLGAVAYVGLDAPASGIVATFDGDFSVGTTPASDGTLTNADVDIVPSTATTQAVDTVAPTTRGAGATQAVLDNTDGSLELNLNLLIDDADIDTDDVVIAATGWLHIAYIVLGDD